MNKMLLKVKIRRKNNKGEEKIKKKIEERKIQEE